MEANIFVSLKALTGYVTFAQIKTDYQKQPEFDHADLSACSSKLRLHRISGFTFSGYGSGEYPLEKSIKEA